MHICMLYKYWKLPDQCWKCTHAATKLKIFLYMHVELRDIYEDNPYNANDLLQIRQLRTPVKCQYHAELLSLVYNIYLF